MKLSFIDYFAGLLFLLFVLFIILGLMYDVNAQEEIESEAIIIEKSPPQGKSILTLLNEVKSAGAKPGEVWLGEPGKAPKKIKEAVAVMEQ